MPFSAKVAEELLVKASRCCCLCHQYKGVKIEVHHIVPEADGGTDDIDNGIPLCFDCHAEVESYNTRHPRGRKFTATELKRHREVWFGLVASGKVVPEAVSNDGDIEIIRFFSECLDRSAFQDPFRQEGSFEAFDRAIEDTITAINTGCLRSRDGKVLVTAKGKSFLSDPELRDSMDTVVDLLRAIRSRYDLAVREDRISLGDEYEGQQFYCFHDPELADWMDSMRGEVIKIFSTVCEKVGISRLRFPRNYHSKRRF